MEVFIKRFLLLVVLSLQPFCSAALCKAYFTPGDDITALFVSMIDAEKNSIHGAIYMFTDKKIAQALVNAKKRGVDVQIIVDQISMVSCGKGKFLQENGVPIFVHRTEAFNPYTMALMHHKFFIFGCNCDNKSWLWTGSWNCTLRANAHNDENVLVLDDEPVIKSYGATFQKLQNRLSE